MMFSCRTIRTEKGKIVAACDRELLGDTYSEGDVKLDVDEEFYSGEELELAGVIEALKDFFTANLVGNDLVEEGMVESSEIEEVDGVKHVHLFRV